MAKPPPPHVNPFASKKKPGVTKGAIARRASKSGKPKHKIPKDKIKKATEDTKKAAFDPKTFFKNKH